MYIYIYIYIFIYLYIYIYIYIYIYMYVYIYIYINIYICKYIYICIYQQKNTESSQFDFKKCETVAQLVCAADHEPVVKRKQSEYILKTNRYLYICIPIYMHILCL
jgi:hypothetical protein